MESKFDLESENEDQKHGIDIVKKAIQSPLRTIVSNSGGEGAVVVQKVIEGEGDFGYNARTDTYENLITSGVIDPVKVTRLALENAASISSLVAEKYIYKKIKRKWLEDYVIKGDFIDEEDKE